MKIYLMRHAIAVPQGSPGYSKDADRPLTLDGREKLFAVAQGLKKLDLHWDLIVTSPWLRAKQTAQVVAEVFAMPNLVQESFVLTPRHSTKELIAMIQQLPPAKSLLLIGHEPAISMHLSDLLCGHGDGRFDFKKAAVAALEFEGVPALGEATLLWMMAPAQMQRLGKKRKA